MGEMDLVLKMMETFIVLHGINLLSVVILFVFVLIRTKNVDK